MSETRISSLLGKITVFLVICSCGLSAQAKYGGGTGGPNDPYLIFDANHMQAIGADANDWDKHFLLCTDIDLSGYTGTSFNIIGNFTGVFDGNGHTISNFTYDSNGVNYIGLFGYVVDPNAEIKNLGLITPDVNAGTGRYVGSLVGRNFGTINNCYSTGSVIGGNRVGGLVGEGGGHISNCYATGSVSGNSSVGGLVGLIPGFEGNPTGTITNCYSTGEVSGTGWYVGGLVGLNYGTVSDCYATAYVSGDWYVGGLVGNNHEAEITNCHAIVEVSGKYYVAGLVGNNYWGSISNCRATASVSGINAVGGLLGGNHRGGISNCYSASDVSGNSSVGGLLGSNSPGTISKCYSEGSVSGNSSVGGLCGGNRDGEITNCYATASVAGDSPVGGLVGLNRGTIAICYSIGSVIGDDNGGGLVGDGGGAVYNSFWDIQTSGQSSSDGGTGLPTAEMLIMSTFADAGWDFVGETINGSEDIWRLCADGPSYPQFNWQLLLGDFLCPDRVDFIDYSFFASHWAEDNCGASNDCEGTDLDQLGTVDINDLAIFVGNWLAGPPPGHAGNPNPADGATGIVIDANLSWSPGYWAALHEVYFGTDPCVMPLVATQPVGQESYNPPGDLIRGTTYYWCVDEVSTYGTITGTVWSFTTIPGEAHTPNPADGAVIPGSEIEYPPGSDNWYIYTKLIFAEGPTADPDPSVRRAYFSNNRDDAVNRVQDANLGPPPYASTPGLETTYYAGNPVVSPANDTLVRGMTYYWCVDETDADGHTYPGDIWEFTIQGFYAFAPNPPNDAVLVDPNVALSWDEGYGVQEHDIYLGTSWDDVNNADANDATGIYRGFRMDPNYPCSNLELATRYYWRVDEVQGRLPPLFTGIIYKGDVWNFTTGDPLPP